tara:strand:+ start:2448 stop:3572 length:1125 start_codon:yes stop_codon:yes gene_type:complete
MKVKKLTIGEFSDVHLNHRKTSTQHILKNLSKAFPSDPTFGNYDIIFIAGDFFDSLMHLPEPDVIDIRIWINRFLRMCKRYDVVLRVLEGTPSHDWKQSRLFTHINEIAEIGADVKYAETLSIEYIERFGINVLYVPDEWNPECDDTWLEVKQLLRERGLEKVHFSVMHGAFDFQLPSHISAPTHDPERYLSITEFLVFIGHVHRFATHDRIVSAGSFDRLTHGEEEPKGHVDATVYQDGRYEITFVENKGAKLYKTFKCTGMEVNKALRYLDGEIKKLPQDSHIRIEAARTDAILANLQLLKSKYPEYNFTPKHDKETEPKKQTVIDIRETYQPVPITRNNIEKLLLDRLKEKGVTSEQLARAEELLNEHVGA